MQAAAPPLAALAPLTRGLTPWLLIALVLVAHSLPGVFAMPPLDRDESRYMQATTQMFETGDFVRISFQDDPRNKKPIGIHWAQAAVVGPTGAAEARNVPAFRVPSLLGALVACWATFWIGARLFSREVGLVAGLGLAATVLIGTEAGIAKTDAALVGSIAVAMAGLAALRTGGSRGAAFAFWGAIGAAILIKGPVGPMVVGLAVLTLVIWERRAAWLAPLLSPWPIALGAAIALPWMIAIGIATDGAFFREALMGDLAPKLTGGHERHPGPPGYHLAILPIIFFPMVILAPVAVLAGLRAFRGDADPALRFLVAWAVPTLLVFEAAPTKLFHYTLPMHPALALLAAAGLALALGGGRIARGAATLVFGLGATVAVAVLVAIPREMDGDATTGLVLGAGVGVLSLGALAAMWMGRTVPMLALTVLAGVAFGAGARGVVLPGASDLDLSRRTSAALVAQGLHPRLSPGAPGPLVGASYNEPSLVFLTRTDSVLDRPETAAAAARVGAGAVIEADKLAAFRQELLAQDLTAREVARVSGLNYSKGDPTTLVILRIEPAQR